MSASDGRPEICTVIFALASLPPDRDERILFALRGLGVDGELGAVARTKDGKPFLPARPDVQFSVSHSGTLWVCARCGRPVGVDLQQTVNCPRERLAQRFFHPDETAWLADCGYEAFFRVWTAKESFLKCTGRGLFAGLDSFSVVRDGTLAAPDGYTLCYLDCPEGYTMAVITENV